MSPQRVRTMISRRLQGVCLPQIKREHIGVIVGNSNPASRRSRIGRCSWSMRDVCSLIWLALIGLFRSRASLQAEILTLRHQLNVLRRKSPQRLTFTSIDRLVFAGLYRLAPGVLDALKIVRPETVIRWHRAGFRAYWRWKSRPRRPRWRSVILFER